MRFLSLVLLLLAPLAASAAPLPADAADPFARLATLRPYEMDEVLWLARCLLSESNRADEQRLVAWVVRNRVETGYRGSAYREVVLEKFQFSAFNEPSERRTYLLGLNQTSRHDAAWRTALGIALDVYRAPASERPFSTTTRHFYSPVSMPGRSTPAWAEGRTPVALAEPVDPDRFLFFEDVDYADDATWLRKGTVARAAGGTTPEGVQPSGRVGSRMEALRSRMRTSVKRPQRPGQGGKR